LLRARTNVWVRIEDEGGNALVSQTLPKGDVYHVPDRTGLVLIVRDAGALEYSLDGKPYARLGRPGQILVSHPLLPDKISAIGG
jgi:cytoskeleton protein RodZ